ncbi:PREDICTED: uncharacterized protein LOC105458730 isoform X1 [Wasmannia auropunctata]|uniref:uncharacterized protein LOC105458730 isoform X1 n=1 Tax=Wasmannia auropunctata TaxID=64793 RepID=UPI0005EEC982|nr:PREDICTED: uncharacterized protein LOC105458730 isoform X1 [Wasmannia auropunctata]XP_011702551.1 PREDICTED: uncharacterized protein LOC105458730 isoform X1 [Wasmannia auropunctata]
MKKNRIAIGVRAGGDADRKKGAWDFTRTSRGRNVRYVRCVLLAIENAINYGSTLTHWTENNHISLVITRYNAAYRSGATVYVRTMALALCRVYATVFHYTAQRSSMNQTTPINP